jgi:hypothetical protein
VCHAKDKFAFADLRAESYDFLFLHYLFLGRLSHVRTFACKRTIGASGGVGYHGCVVPEAERSEGRVVGRRKSSAGS